jgi:hypothetical protein
MFFNGGYFYYLTLGLNIYCVIHSYRRGTLNKWIWLIVFIPVIGSLIYIYSEILSNRQINTPKIDVDAVLNPGGKLKKLEDQLGFADTFANKIKLADAYLAAGFTDKAVDLYQNSLTGAFAENEYVMAQLITAYYQQEQYQEVIALAKKLYKLPQFPRSKAHLYYALSLEMTGDIEAAELEFKAMKGRYSYFEQRYQYGLFLMRTNREQDAWHIFTDMINEQPHLGPVERKTNRIWFVKTKDELKRITSVEDV